MRRFEGICAETLTLVLVDIAHFAVSPRLIISFIRILKSLSIAGSVKSWGQGLILGVVKHRDMEWFFYLFFSTFAKDLF